MTIDGETHPLPARSWCSPRKTPSSTRARTRYPRPSSTASRCGWRSDIHRSPMRPACLSSRTTDPPLDDLRPVAGPEEVQAAVEAAREVYVEESVNRYVVALLRHTRERPPGSRREPSFRDRPAADRESPRARRTPRLRPPRGRTKRRRAGPSHRLILAPEARSGGVTPADAVREAVAGTPAPV